MNHLFSLLFVASSTETALVKIHSNNTQAWSERINLKTAIKSLTVDTTENNIYFIKYQENPMIVIRLNAITGTLVSAQSQ